MTQRVVFEGYGVNLNELLKQWKADAFTSNDSIISTLQNVINRHSFIKFIAAFNAHRLMQNDQLPTVGWGAGDGKDYIYITKKNMQKFITTDQMIPVLTDCIAFVLWSEYSSLNKENKKLLNEDLFQATVKSYLIDHQHDLFSKIYDVVLV